MDKTWQITPHQYEQIGVHYAVTVVGAVETTHEEELRNLVKPYIGRSVMYRRTSTGSYVFCRLNQQGDLDGLNVDWDGEWVDITVYRGAPAADPAEVGSTAAIVVESLPDRG